MTSELRRQQLHGWFSSLVLHSLLLLAVFPLFRLSPLAVPKKLFHWDIALVQSPSLADKPAQNSSAPEPIISRPTERTPLQARAGRPIHRAVSSADPIVPIKPQTAEPVMPTPQPSTTPSTSSSRESSTASVVEKSTANPAQVETPPMHQIEELTGSATTAPPPSETAANVATDHEHTAASNTTPLAMPTESSASTSNPDYGWLQHAIFQRLEELKLSSRPFLDQSQPFKVVVKAVVSKEGALLDSVVVKSSGLDRIDQEARALVQRAFPMQFDRTLNRQQIIMRIPISYSRD